MREKISEATIGLPVSLGKLEPSKPESSWPEDALPLRIIGCDGYRQCEVHYEFGVLVLRERGQANSHYVTIGLDTLFRRAFVSIIKANDGLSPDNALEHGLKALQGFGYVEVAEETKP